jgi:excisionase family DNA binding protein
MAQHTTANHTPRLAYSLQEASHLTDISVRSLRYLIRCGRLGYVRIGRRVLIRHSDIEALLRRHAVKPATPLDAEAPIRPKRTE